MKDFTRTQVAARLEHTTFALCDLLHLHFERDHEDVDANGYPEKFCDECIRLALAELHLVAALKVLGSEIGGAAFHEDYRQWPEVLPALSRLGILFSPERAA